MPLELLIPRAPPLYVIGAVAYFIWTTHKDSGFRDGFFEGCARIDWTPEQIERAFKSCFFVLALVWPLPLGVWLSMQIATLSGRK